ncbi:DMT family transporter [Granulosicoccaceae sp. 1_MG-2023]|nr:DMT family transporter [Granulosicoccaceae sp. 1_MG-2023]
MDSIAKILMQDLPPLQVTWARFFFHTLIMVILFAATGQKQVFQTRAPRTQLVRGLCMAGVNSTLYIALMSISLAEATAIMYLAPIIVTLLAGTLLGERITRQHLIAVVLGFLGVLIIIRPGFGQFQPGLLLTLFAATVLALYFLLTRKVSAVDSNRTSLFYSAVVGAVLLSLIVPFVWIAPTPMQWLTLIFMGLLGASGHFLFIEAYRLQPAAELSPWLNAQVVAATVFSVIWLGDSLDIFFLAGATLIIGAGLLLWWQTRRL